MSVQRAVEPDVRPVERGLYQIGERRERAPKQPFPDVPEREERKRKPERPAEDATDAPTGDRRIDIRV